jgi:hypothetical protein
MMRFLLQHIEVMKAMGVNQEAATRVAEPKETQ